MCSSSFSSMSSSSSRYNFSVRQNRMVLAQLDSFAHDLYAFLTTGSHVAGESVIAPVRGAALARGAA